MERASQAHALMLAEARVGSKWWKHLKGLNTQVRHMLEWGRWPDGDGTAARLWHVPVHRAIEHFR